NAETHDLFAEIHDLFAEIHDRTGHSPMRTSTDTPTSRSTRPFRHRLAPAGALGAATLTSLALALGPTATPAQATDLVPQTETEAQVLLDARHAEDSSSLNRGHVPEGISAAEARPAADKSDEITSSDIEYAAALEDLPSDDVPEDFYQTPDQLADEDGAVVKQSPSTFYLDPVKLIEHNAKTTAFMYKTTDEQGTARAST